MCVNVCISPIAWGLDAVCLANVPIFWIEKKAICVQEWEMEIEQLQTDSREIVEKGLFFCLEGGKNDGHDYAKQAVRNGAVAVVVSRSLDLSVPQILVNDTRETLARMAATFYGYPSDSLTVVGITGTNGKTTTSYMLAEILKSAGKKVGVIGTLGVKYGHKIIESQLTTPDPVPLQRTLCEMLKNGVEYVVMEVSAHALYYKKVAGVRFSACILTNLTQDHLDFFGDMEGYQSAKSKLFSDYSCPIAVVNGDDGFGRLVGEKRGNEKTIFYGMDTPTDTFSVVTNDGLYGTECMLNLQDELCRVSLQLIGMHNIYNALAAATCAKELGVNLAAISKGLSTIKMVAGRLQRVGHLNGAEVFVDFAHTPDGLKKALETLRKHCKGRLICVFGCGGNRDKEKRPKMGEVAARMADFCVLTSDNPRYEDPLDIISSIEKGYRRFSVRYVVVPDRVVALDYALDYLRKDDVLLVAGKGGEECQEIMGIKYPFNDNNVIEKLLREKAKNGLF